MLVITGEERWLHLSPHSTFLNLNSFMSFMSLSVYQMDMVNLLKPYYRNSDKTSTQTNKYKFGQSTF